MHGNWCKTLVIKKSLSGIHFNFRWAESLSVFAQQKNIKLILNSHVYVISVLILAKPLSETAQRKLKSPNMRKFPMSLPCTTPLLGSASSDSRPSWFGACVSPAKQDLSTKAVSITQYSRQFLGIHRVPKKLSRFVFVRTSSNFHQFR